VVAQDIGQLYTRRATDPNSGLVIAVFAIAMLGVGRGHVGAPVGAAWPATQAQPKFLPVGTRELGPAGGRRWAVAAKTQTRPHVMLTTQGDPLHRS
jgi:hypothetical protein